MATIKQIEDALLLADDENRTDDKEFLKQELANAVSAKMDSGERVLVGQGETLYEEPDTDPTQVAGHVSQRQGGGSAITGPESDPGGRGNIAQQVLQGTTFNLSDEIEAGIGSIFANFVSLLSGDSEITGKSLANEGTMGYDDALESGRADLEAFSARNPNTAMGANIAGGVATGGIGGAKALSSQAMKNAPRFTKIIATPAIYGAEGAVAGFGQGKDLDERLSKAGDQGAIAAILGPLLQLGGTQVGQMLSKKKAIAYQDASSPNKSLQDIKDQAQAFYRTADDADITLKPEVWNEFRGNLRLGLKAEDAYDEIPGAMRKMEKMTMPSYKQLEGLKRKVSRQRINYSDDVKRGVAEDISRSVDDLIAGLEPDDIIQGARRSNLTPSQTMSLGDDVITPSNDLENLGEHLEQARGLWARKSQLESLDDIANRARLSDATLQGDTDKALRSAIRPYLVNPKKKMGLSEDLVSSLDDIVTGKTPGLKISRDLASVAPSSHSARGAFPVTTGGALKPGGRWKAIVNLLPALTGKLGKIATGKSSAGEFEKIRAQLLNLDRPDLAEALEEIMRSGMDQAVKGTAAGVARTAPSLEQMGYE